MLTRYAAFALILLAAAASAAPVELYVSPKGSDTAKGTPSAPVATLAHAQQLVRQLVANGGAGGGVTVIVRGGTYELPQTLSLGTADSGTPQAPIVWRAQPGEKPILAGGRLITGWKPYKGNILQCDLKPLGLAKDTFRQLFFQGQRMTLARTPNFDPNDPHGGTWAYVMGVEGDENHTEFTYAPEVEHNWAKPTEADVCIFPGFDWAWNIIRIAKVDRDAHRITLAGNVSCALRNGDRYFVQGLMEELDAPGEWYLDKATSTLYFWPPSDVTKGDVIAPMIDTVVEMKGAKSVALRGFTVEACDGDAVRIDGSEGCQVAACTIRNCGGWGVGVYGGHNSGAFGNDVYACGAGGVAIDGGDRKTLAPGGNYARNNYCHHFAVFARTYNTGINCTGVGNIVANNLVHDAPHAGLIVGGNDNTVEYNIVHHVNLQSADTGGIYFCSRDWTQRGNTIRYNIFHDIGGFGKSWGSRKRGKIEFAYPHFTWGIYLDDPTTGTVVYGNILYRVPVCGLHNHGGRDNTWENNIVVDSPALNAGMLWDQWGEWPDIFKRLDEAVYPGSPYLTKYPELSKYNKTNPAAMTGVKVLHNIFYYTKAGTAWLRGERKDWGENTQLLYDMNMQKTDFPQNQWDHNTLYLEPGLKPVINLGLQPEQGRHFTWEEWQKLGGDPHSILADPLFVNAAQHDYRLKPDSPALKQGFKPIPTDKIGPFKDDLRASWPIAEAPGASRFGDLVTFRYVDLPEYALVPAKPFAVREGLGNFAAKAAAGGPLKIAYFGGGINPANGFRAQVIKWLQARYPTAQVTELDASINDCVRGSGFSFWRYQHDVLDQKPDLVFVDFVSDDSEGGDPKEIMRCIEPIARWTRQADPKLDVVFLYAFRTGLETDFAEGNSPPTISAYEKIADHYGVPSISMAYHVAELSRAGKALIKSTDDEAKAAPGKPVLFRNGVWPLPDADSVYTEAIVAGLTDMLKTGPAPHPLPTRSFLPDNYQRAKQFPITREMLTGEWTALPDNDPLFAGNKQYFPALWLTKQPGAKLSFKFKGTSATIFDFMGPDTGKAQVTVDGKVAAVLAQVDPWSWYQRQAVMPLCSGLEDKEHTVTVELLPDAPDRATPKATAAKQPNFDMSVFNGVALRFGCLRLMGELVQ